ncbi:molecular chaperone OsmY [Oceanisphaera avium]|uniref:Osmotically-inducible protein Y n=1 Tax=Oceanisphaera avium TaxID=1903694 RepID=A0A1Y0CUS8_9GAMM|nr:molecular chaperone OsmY [Oceanisphaera avium]ART79101.1 molecular chaperone OsmY [Oceanisphaera avium]
MKKVTFSHSMIAVVLSSVLAGGSAFAADATDPNGSMMSTKKENAAEHENHTINNAANSTKDAARTTKENAADSAREAAHSTKETANDGIITTKVKAELVQADAIKSGDISVETENGVVTLSGFVESQEQIKHAVEVAGKVEGVASVNDKLNVKDNADQSLKEYADDAMITSAVKAKFLADDVVPGLSVSVETQDGVVQLTGDVESQEQVTQAENVAKGVDGVQSVKNDLVIKKK